MNYNQTNSQLTCYVTITLFLLCISLTFLPLSVILPDKQWLFPDMLHLLMLMFSKSVCDLQSDRSHRQSMTYHHEEHLFYLVTTFCHDVPITKCTLLHHGCQLFSSSDSRLSTDLSPGVGGQLNGSMYHCRCHVLVETITTKQ